MTFIRRCKDYTDVAWDDNTLVFYRIFMSWYGTAGYASEGFLFHRGRTSDE